jgi:aspartyl-tRNA(Asn)/glutamyl-tRNA(Gln) amidotransferase subunit A
LVIKTLTAETRDIAMTVDIDRTLQLAESYAVHAELVARSPELYQPETLRRIREGENISPAQVEEGRRQLEQQRREIERVFAGVEVVVTPTTPMPALVLAELQEHPDQLRPAEIVLLRNTRPFNVWGIPAISVPCGFTKAGLPIGLQICAAAGQEGKVLQLAHAYEQATEWRKRRRDL